MKKFLKKIPKNNKAFTMVEMIVVIAVLAIMGVIATPIFLSYIEKTREATDKNAVYEVAHAAETAYIKGDKKAITNKVRMVIKSTGIVSYGISDFEKDVSEIMSSTAYVYKSKAYKGNKVEIIVDEVTGKATVIGPKSGKMTADDFNIDNIPIIGGTAVGDAFKDTVDEFLAGITDEQWDDINETITNLESAGEEWDAMDFNEKVGAINGAVNGAFPDIPTIPDIDIPDINWPTMTPEPEGGEEGSGNDDGCVAAGSEVTLADGSVKKIEDLNKEDKLLAFNHETGEYVAADILTIAYHGYGCHFVMNLNFSDGVVVRLIDYHGLFDVTLNKYVYLTNDNFMDYVGHKFAMQSDAGYKTVVLERAYLSYEYVGVYAVATDYHINCFTNGILSIIPEVRIAVDAFEFDSDLKFDEEKMQCDIEKYGLYEYKDFAAYVDEEVFNLLPFKYIKVCEGKGIVSSEEVLEILEKFIVYFEIFGDEASYIEDII